MKPQQTFSLHFYDVSGRWFGKIAYVLWRSISVVAINVNATRHFLQEICARREGVVILDDKELLKSQNC